MTLSKNGCDLHEPRGFHKVRPQYFLELENPLPPCPQYCLSERSGHSHTSPPPPLGVDVLDGSPPIKLVLLPQSSPANFLPTKVTERNKGRKGGREQSALCCATEKGPFVPPFHAPPLLASPATATAARRPQYLLIAECTTRLSCLWLASRGNQSFMLKIASMTFESRL